MYFATIGKTYAFEAAHLLPNHKALDGSPGQCSRLHGHSYKLLVELTAPIQLGADDTSSYGFVQDFAHLSAVVKREIIDKMDHQYLNDVLPFRTTAELMAQYIFGRLQIECGLPVHKIVLWETAKSYASVTDRQFSPELYDRLLIDDTRTGR